MMVRPVLAAFCCAATLAACETGGTSSAEAEQAAEQQVRERFGLGENAEMETNVFVGTPRDGETILCGTVRPAAGATFPPQRFIAETDPARFLVFEKAGSLAAPSQPGMFPEWEVHCSGETAPDPSEPAV